MEMIDSVVSWPRKQSVIRVWSYHVLHHPIMESLKITAGVRPTEFRICSAIIANPEEGNQPNVSGAHEPLT